MGDSIKKQFFLWFLLSTLFLPIQNGVFSQTKEQRKASKRLVKGKSLYYSYWNSYRRKLDNKQSRDFFISVPYFEAVKNKQGKKVKFGFQPSKEASSEFSWKLPQLAPANYIVDVTFLGKYGHKMKDNFGFMVH